MRRHQFSFKGLVNGLSSATLTGVAVGLSGGLALAGVFVWYSGYITGSSEPPFVFAGVTGTIGALLLTGFVVRSDRDKKEAPSLLATSGKLFLAASLGFLGLGMFYPSLKIQNPSEFVLRTTVAVNLACLVLASVSLMGAIMLLVLVFPKLEKSPAGEER